MNSLTLSQKKEDSTENIYPEGLRNYWLGEIDKLSRDEMFGFKFEEVTSEENDAGFYATLIAVYILSRYTNIPEHTNPKIQELFTWLNSLKYKDDSQLVQILMQVGFISIARLVCKVSNNKTQQLIPLIQYEDPMELILDSCKFALFLSGSLDMRGIRVENSEIAAIEVFVDSKEVSEQEKESLIKDLGEMLTRSSILIPKRIEIYKQALQKYGITSELTFNLKNNKGETYDITFKPDTKWLILDRKIGWLLFILECYKNKFTPNILYAGGKPDNSRLAKYFGNKNLLATGFN